MEIITNKEYMVECRWPFRVMFAARALNVKRNRVYCEWTVYDPDIREYWLDSGWINKRRFICEREKYYEGYNSGK